jgi:hypothetical protein
MLDRGLDPIRHMSQRLTRSLEKALGRKVDYWFSYDKGDSDDPFDHLHGELRCLDGNEHPKILAALREAGGPGYGGNNKHRETQAHIDAHNVDDIWVSYSIKARSKRTKFGIDLTTGRIIKGEREPAWIERPAFITERLKREARELYDAVRPYVRLDGKGLKAAASAADESVDVSGRAAAATTAMGAGAATDHRETAIEVQVIEQAPIEAKPARRARPRDEWWADLDEAVSKAFAAQAREPTGADKAIIDEISAL